MHKYFGITQSKLYTWKVTLKMVEDTDYQCMLACTKAHGRGATQTEIELNVMALELDT